MTESLIQMPREGGIVVRLIAAPGEQPFVISRSHQLTHNAYTCLKTFQGGWVGECPFCEAYAALGELISKSREEPNSDRKAAFRTLKPTLRGFFIGIPRYLVPSPFAIYKQTEQSPKILMTGRDITETIFNAIHYPESLSQETCCNCDGNSWRHALCAVTGFITNSWYKFRKCIGLPRKEPNIFDIKEGRDLLITKTINGLYHRYYAEFGPRMPLGTKSEIRHWLANLPDLSKMIKRMSYEEAFQVVQDQFGHLPAVANMFYGTIKPTPIPALEEL